MSAISEFAATLSSPLAEVQRSAASAFRLLEKENVDRRISTAEPADTVVGGDSEGAPNVPHKFKCPISMNLMRDPVIIATRMVCRDLVPSVFGILLYLVL